ncbi:UNVERIFIED_CONTAM: hypothetical protein GTU68_051138 [Idotea baltica]|nr:hypothetical protein [Idotea baltica]
MRTHETGENRTCADGKAAAGSSPAPTDSPATIPEAYGRIGRSVPPLARGLSPVRPPQPAHEEHHAM